MESNSENSPETANNSPVESSETTAPAPAANCQDCGRALSATTGKCYYCAEADPEDIKKLNFIMLDWQHKEASDPDLRASEKSKKVISLVQVLMASACIALGFVSDFIPNEPLYYYFIFGALGAVSCWCFHFNSLTVIFTLLVNASAMLYFLNLAFSSMQKNVIVPAFICGFVASLSAFVLFIVTLRIFKNKAVEI